MASGSSSDSLVLLSTGYSALWPEAGCDEAGRGCLAGPVTAAAVILPEGMQIVGLDDSKKMSPKARSAMRDLIIEASVAWHVAEVSHESIDEINILQASILAMQKALAGLSLTPRHIIIDGLHFKTYKNIPHTCIPRADSIYASVAAASVIAKTFRDERMLSLHKEYPQYGWDSNKGYPTPAHRAAIAEYGLSPYHRLSFRHGQQLNLKIG